MVKKRASLKSELRAIESVQKPKTIPNAKLLKSELRAIES